MDLSENIKISLIVVMAVLMVVNVWIQKERMGLLMAFLPLLTFIVFMIGMHFFSEYFTSTFETDGNSMLLVISLLLGLAPAVVVFNTAEWDFPLIAAFAGTVGNAADFFVFLRLFHLINKETYLALVEFCGDPILVLFIPLFLFGLLLYAFFSWL